MSEAGCQTWPGSNSMPTLVARRQRTPQPTPGSGQGPNRGVPKAPSTVQAVALATSSCQRDAGRVDGRQDLRRR